MKKKILSGVFALALLSTAGYGVNKTMSNDASLSDLALMNVEALAWNEGDGNRIPCYGTIRISNGGSNNDNAEPIWVVSLCNGCQLVNCLEYCDPGICTNGDNGGFIPVVG